MKEEEDEEADWNKEMNSLAIEWGVNGWMDGGF